MYSVALIILSIINLVLTSSYQDSFTEELILKPLYSNQLYAHFHFKTKWDVDTRSDSGKRAIKYNYFLEVVWCRFS